KPGIMKADKLKSQLLTDVLRYVADRIERARAAQVETFIRDFYANVPQHDLTDQSPEDLFCAALSLYNFALKRPAGQAKIRVFNPSQDEHGWRSGHSIIEIVNDDMPFLVDSVTAELTRQEIGVHLVIHPVMRVERDDKGQMLGLGKPDAHPESVMQLWVTQ